ncbi:16S rRNA (guanine(966)-N(2))-methyltransferase RsmD [Shewanella glacialimarina]|jgi:16S rRNA (guanine966-N2)-methyltransferase|uniref:16S rRNA (guanine(966)-N(2))-methyltransferase RsmD n=1 Tax=Shewanella glacialimarina TaxID=2590884 RepID=UPI001CF875C8|nr:16S rRNA (guanine(966)-N(2))-methyltransferase RsmD [Shewanella glacialimarina]UCX06288.1 16S rRNA (guanine(966)-N(2))-methyltransferase RsmD [Shewanella glacialimarina]
MARQNSSSGQVRIISGQWRSRKLPIHDLEGLRPTTDRVRETLFNWLSVDIRGARVLDCFAGSGALSLESLSRYAEFALMFELQKSAANQLTKNLHTLNCINAKVINGDSLQLLAKGTDQGFDVVYIDPPFRKGLAKQTIELLMAHGWLNNDALIYLETETDLTDLVIPANWFPLKQKTAGQVSYRLYAYQSET